MQGIVAQNVQIMGGGYVLQEALPPSCISCSYKKYRCHMLRLVGRTGVVRGYIFAVMVDFL